MTRELHTHMTSRPQMMLKAIEEVRNEKSNAREYKGTLVANQAVLQGMSNALVQLLSLSPALGIYLLSPSDKFNSQDVPQYIISELKCAFNYLKKHKMDEDVQLVLGQGSTIIQRSKAQLQVMREYTARTVKRFVGQKRKLDDILPDSESEPICNSPKTVQILLEFYARDHTHNPKIYSVTEQKRKIEYNPTYNTVQALFTFLICTAGIGSSVFAIKKSVFNKLYMQEKTRQLEELNRIREKRQSDIKFNTLQLPFIQDAETRQELWKDLQLIKPGLVFPANNLTDFVMLAYTDEDELLMSKPIEFNQSPNYAIYMGQVNIFENCQEHIHILGEDHGLRFHTTPEYTKAIDLAKVDTHVIDGVLQETGNKVIVFSQKREDNTDATSTTSDWYALVHMKKLTRDICAICLDDNDHSALEKQCITDCGHIFHNRCLNGWFETMKEKFPTRHVKCPLCETQLADSFNRVNCNGNATEGFDKTWVTYAMELQRKLPKLLKDFNGITAEYKVNLERLDVHPMVVSDMIRYCIGFLKQWFHPGYYFDKNTNEVIALYILLYKYCVLTQFEVKTIQQIDLQLAVHTCQGMIDDIYKEGELTYDTICDAVHKKREECPELIRLDKTLILEMNRNKVFPGGLPQQHPRAIAAASTGATL